MGNQAVYNANPELSTMKEDVADRSSKLQIKHYLIMAGSIVAGIAAGAVLLPMFMGPAALLLGMSAGGSLGLLAGGTIAELLTAKERTKLNIDKDMVQSYMQGKNHWGAGYRQEVAEYGYGGPQLPNKHGMNVERRV